MPHFSPSTAALLPGVIVGLVLAGGCSHCHMCKQKPSPAEKQVGYPDWYCAGYFPTCWRRWPDDCPSCPVELGGPADLGVPCDQGGPGDVRGPCDVGEVLPPESLPPGKRSDDREEILGVPDESSPNHGANHSRASDAAPPSGLELPKRDGAARDGDSSPAKAPPPDDGTNIQLKVNGPLVPDARAPQSAPQPSKAKKTSVVKRKPSVKSAPLNRTTPPNDRVVPRRGVPKGKAPHPKAKSGTGNAGAKVSTMVPDRAEENRDPVEGISRGSDKPPLDRTRFSMAKLMELFRRRQPAPDGEPEEAATVVLKDGPRTTEPAGRIRQ